MNTAQLAGLIRQIAQLLSGLLVAHGYKDTSWVESAVGGVASIAVWYWSHRSNTPDAMLTSAVKASGGAITATTSPESSDTTIVVRKPADVPAAVQPKTP